MTAAGGRARWSAAGLALAAVLASGALRVPARAAAEPPAEIGGRRELFVDGWLLASTRGAVRRLHAPQRQEVAFRFDAPWEGRQCGYVTVLRDGDRFRMYYRGGGDQTREVTCMAESAEGRQWTRPRLGLHEFQGSRGNNILLMPREKGYVESHNFTPFVDPNPAAPPDERYKAMALGKFFDPQLGDRRKMLFAFVSPDGIRWRRLGEEPVLREGSFDSQNVAFWDTARREYVSYSRGARDGVRSILRSTSPDFRRWSPQEWIDLGPGPAEHLYTNAIAPYFRAPHLYLGFPMRFVPTRTRVGAEERTVDALSDAVLISSRDGRRWDRSFPEAFLRPGPDPRNWGNGHGNNTPAWGLLPSGDGELSLYWNEHYGGIPQLRRGTVRVDGFASLAAPAAGGEAVTRPLVFRGRRLVLNYATSAVGSVHVELQNAEGRPLPGYSLADCSEIYGDETARPVAWKGGRDVGALAGKPMRLRLVLRDADLYSLQFQD